MQARKISLRALPIVTRCYPPLEEYNAYYMLLMKRQVVESGDEGKTQLLNLLRNNYNTMLCTKIKYREIWNALIA